MTEKSLSSHANLGNGNPQYSHGHAQRGRHSKTYNSWVAMKGRCLYPSHNAFHRYGGRGIKICSRWLKFENFLKDMGERPEGKSLDRIDNDGNYEPKNCKWSTTREQNLNHGKLSKTLQPVLCQGCNKKIQPSKKTRKFCSLECFNYYKVSHRMSIICKNCNINFNVPLNKVGVAKYCSVNCKHESGRGRRAN